MNTKFTLLHETGLGLRVCCSLSSMSLVLRKLEFMTNNPYPSCQGYNNAVIYIVATNHTRRLSSSTIPHFLHYYHPLLPQTFFRLFAHSFRHYYYYIITALYFPSSSSSSLFFCFFLYIICLWVFCYANIAKLSITEGNPTKPGAVLESQHKSQRSFRSSFKCLSRTLVVKMKSKLRIQTILVHPYHLWRQAQTLSWQVSIHFGTGQYWTDGCP